MPSSKTLSGFAPLVYTPKFFLPDKAYDDFEQDISAAYCEGVEFGREHKLETAQRLMKSGIKHSIMLTDLQGGKRKSGFRDHSRSLPVNGTDDVVLRACIRLINGTVNPFFTTILYSQDGHPINHISFDTYWRDANGKPLDIREIKAARLTLVDEKKCVFKAYGYGKDGKPFDIGFYRPQFDPYDAVDYWKHLQTTDQGDIWVFVVHCVLGTEDADLHPFLAETIAFCAGARSIHPKPIFKGHLSNVDWFGPLRPCREIPDHPQGGFQKNIIDDYFIQSDSSEFWGVAEDFCDFYMKKEVVVSLAGTEHAKKIRFVTDGTAPIIAHAPHVLEQNKLALAAGVKFIRHDTPFEES